MPPEKVVDVQALCGDSVDNVPGAPGIGIKTASALINEYGDLDTLLARAGEIKQDKRRQTLIDFAEQIRLSRQLVTLDCETPLPEPLEELARRRSGPEGAGRLPGGDGVPQPGAARGRGALRRRADRPAAEAAATEAPKPIDHSTLRLRPRPRRRSTPGSPGRAAAGVVALRRRDRRRLARPPRTSAASRWRWRRARPATSRSATPPPRGWRSRARPTSARSRWPTALARLKALLEDPSVLKVGHNAKYEIAVFPRSASRWPRSRTPC